MLTLDAGECDADSFEHAGAAARSSAAGGDHAAALAAFDDCLRLWRGGAYLEFADEPFAIAERSRLDELRMLALEDRMASALALGRHAEAVPTLETLTADQPYRERLWELRMLALYRADRQAEALQCFREVERNLVEGLGLSPGTRLATIESQILAHAPERTGDVIAPAMSSR